MIYMYVQLKDDQIIQKKQLSSNNINALKRGRRGEINSKITVSLEPITT